MQSSQVRALAGFTNGARNVTGVDVTQLLALTSPQNGTDVLVQGFTVQVPFSLSHRSKRFCMQAIYAGGYALRVMPAQQVSLTACPIPIKLVACSYSTCIHRAG